MNKKQLQKDFFPPEIILKIYRDIPHNHYIEKVKLVNDYAEEVRESYDEDVVKICLNNQLAHIYWESEQYSQAISHFEIVIDSMKPEDHSLIYFLALLQLIRCNRLLSNFKAAEKWAGIAWENHHLANAILNLAILNDYADVIEESETSLDKKYHPLIQSIIDEYGFPEKLEDPIATIRSMQKKHKYWNNKLNEIIRICRNSDRLENIKEWEKYLDSCEIVWFRNYARNTLDEITSK